MKLTLLHPLPLVLDLRPPFGLSGGDRLPYTLSLQGTPRPAGGLGGDILLPSMGLPPSSSHIPPRVAGGSPPPPPLLTRFPPVQDWPGELWRAHGAATGKLNSPQEPAAYITQPPD